MGLGGLGGFKGLAGLARALGFSEGFRAVHISTVTCLWRFTVPMLKIHPKPYKPARVPFFNTLGSRVPLNPKPYPKP